MGHRHAAPVKPALLLGPVAVAPDCRNRGIGAAPGPSRAQRWRAGSGHRAVILVGDAPYYGRFGFSAEKTAALRMPGPFERQRLLGLELVPGALDGARGLLARARPACSQPATRCLGRLICSKIPWTPDGLSPGCYSVRAPATDMTALSGEH